MSLPEQIQKQVDRANELIEQHYKPAEDAAASSEAEQIQQADAEPVAAAAPAQEPEVAQPVSQAVTPGEDENSPTYAQRWRSLQGINQSLQHNNQLLTARVGQLEHLISSLQQAPATQVQASKPFVTDKDAEDFGADMVDFAGRVAKQEIQPLLDEIAALKSELSAFRGVVPRVQNVEAQQARTREQQFFIDLAQAVPDWRDVNASPKFKEWLLAPDGMTGITRQTYLEDAQSSGDVARVANIFNVWKEASGSQTPRPKQKVVTSELEKQVAPGRAVQSATPPADPGSKTYSRQDITKFYGDVRRGVYKGREAEMKAVEDDIFVAQREGRIT